MEKGFPFAPIMVTSSSDSKSGSLNSRQRKGKRKTESVIVEGDDRPKKSSISINSSNDDADERTASSSGTRRSNGHDRATSWYSPLDSVAPTEEVVDGTMAVIRGAQNSKAALLILSRTCTRYISGFCKITLLRGAASIHGYALSVGQCVDSVYCPMWTPAARLHATGRIPRKSSKNSANSNNSVNSGSSSILSLLRKNNKIHYFSEILENNQGNTSTDGTPAVSTIGNANVACNMIDASECVLLVEGLHNDEMPWLAAVEDLRSYSDSSTYVTSHNIGGMSLPDAQSCVSVGSAIIGDINAIAQKKIFCTRLPPSWVSVSDSLLQLCKGKRGQQAIPTQIHGISAKHHVSPRVLICGAKGVGKSTCLRYMINRLLSKNTAVCVLDIDVGQPEYGVPGTVSLTIVQSPNLSPPHLHMKEPIESYYFGDITSKGDSSRVQASVMLLLQKYLEINEKLAAGDNSVLKSCPPDNSNYHGIESTKKSTLKKSGNINEKDNNLPPNTYNIFDVLEDDDPDDHAPRAIQLPLVVNTDGFIRYMGSEILQSTVQIVQPDMIIQVVSDKDKNISALYTVPNEKIYRVECGSSEPSTVSSLDLRNLRIVSYFLGNNSTINHHIFNNKHNKDVSLVAENEYVESDIYVRNGTLVDKLGFIYTEFCSITALSLPLHENAIACLSDEIPINLLLAALNASLVGICVSNRRNWKSHCLSSNVSAASNTITIQQETRNFSDTNCDSLHLGLLPCIGLALVRSVNVSSKSMHVLCPSHINSTALNIIQKKYDNYGIALIRGRMALPAFMQFSPGMPIHPYMTNDSAGDGSSQTKARNNVKRRTYR